MSIYGFNSKKEVFDLADFLLVEQKTHTQTLVADTKYSEQLIDIAKTGYYPVGIVGYESSEPRVLVNELKVVVDEDTHAHVLILAFENTKSSSVSWTFKYQILYRKVE